MLSLHFYKFWSEGCSTFFTYEQNPDKASIYQQTQIDSQFLPSFLLQVSTLQILYTRNYQIK